MNATTTRLSVVCQGPECEQRYLDEHRSPDCQLFCRRVGTGGPYTHCDEPVTISDLNLRRRT